MTALAFQYPANWPTTPFHPGELALQDKFGVRDHIHSYAPKFVRPCMPEQHQEFYESLPFLAVAARDDEGRMWATLLMSARGEAGFIKSPDATSLSIHARPVSGDALEHSLQQGSDLGILGIEFATKRRNRVNGRIINTVSSGLEFQVDQSFGNCPQYIRPRKWWTAPQESLQQEKNKTMVTSHLTPRQMETIRKSDTLFTATGYRGDGQDVRYGNDASHRGGVPGWMDVRDQHTIFLPDYSGNNHYNTMGNLVMDNRMGLAIPQFETGAMLQLTGRTKLHLDEEEAALMYPGAKHVIEFTVEQVVELPEGSLPVRWSQQDTRQNERKLQVVHKVKESDDVTSFHLEAVPGDDPELWSYQPGQHLPILLDMDDGTTLMRTYSLSSGPDRGDYRISVKREPFGKASSFLHDNVQVGDQIQVSRPAGDFILRQGSERTLVLISAGIGVTPILSMLHAFVQSQGKQKAVWVHGARDGKYHPFQGEIKGLARLAGDSLKQHIVYSRPREEDKGYYDTNGHVNAELVKSLVPDLHKADFFMCGTAAFMADVEDGLLKLGVESKFIQYETF